MARDGADPTASPSHPYPPFELANRVLALSTDDGYGGFLSYEMLGHSTRDELCDLLPDDFDFAGARVLDFGCGAGRTLRHFLAEAETAEVWGADIDARSVGWVESNLSPPLHVVRSEIDPPLPFDASSFDLIWAISVFTHLTDSSARWLLELHRILKPGGLLMASYMGKWNSEEIAGEPWDPDRIGFNVMRHNGPWERGGPLVLISDWWMREHWGRAFEIVAVKDRVQNQTWPMLRKRDVSLTAEELVEPAADDPRELRALQHNVHQLQNEIEDITDRAQRLERSWQELRSSRLWRLFRSAYELTPAGRRRSRQRS